jgi:hypothetical protein
MTWSAFRRGSLRALLVLETVLTMPFFLLSWMLCGIVFAAIAGYRVASAFDQEEKKDVLEKIFDCEDE